MTRTIWMAPASPIRSSWTRIALTIATGLVVGCLTSLGQAHLNGALNALVNSAGAWLVAPFFVGALMRTPRGAAAAGLTTCALQLVGYYVTAHLRGFGAGASIVVFWTACAFAGGPLFALAGRHWRMKPDGLGAAVLPAAFVAEGLWLYLHELHYYATAALWLAIGAGLSLALSRHALRWFAVTLPLALAGEIVVSAISIRGF